MCTCGTNGFTTTTNTGYCHTFPPVATMSIENKLDLFRALTFSVNDTKLEISTRVAMENRIKELIDELR